MIQSLPHLQAIFDKLKIGYHISYEDGPLYAALAEDSEEAYKSYFGNLGLKLVRHERDFFYFEPEQDEQPRERLAKVAVFAYILIDHTASQGRAIEQTIMGESFLLRNLPHFSLDSYRARMNQVRMYEPDELKGLVNYLEKIGWAKWVGVEEFCFLRPFHRMFAKCLELSLLSADRVSEPTLMGEGDSEQPVSTKEDSNA